MIWTGVIWLEIGSNGRLLWPRSELKAFIKSVSWLAVSQVSHLFLTFITSFPRRTLYPLRDIILVSCSFYLLCCLSLNFVLSAIVCIYCTNSNSWNLDHSALKTSFSRASWNLYVLLNWHGREVWKSCVPWSTLSFFWHHALIWLLFIWQFFTRHMQPLSCVDYPKV